MVNGHSISASTSTPIKPNCSHGPWPDASRTPRHAGYRNDRDRAKPLKIQARRKEFGQIGAVFVACARHSHHESRFAMAVAHRLADME
jgi:hypothetical protein